MAGPPQARGRPKILLLLIKVRDVVMAKPGGERSAGVTAGACVRMLLLLLLLHRNVLLVLPVLLFLPHLLSTIACGCRLIRINYKSSLVLLPNGVRPCIRPTSCGGALLMECLLRHLLRPSIPWCLMVPGSRRRALPCMSKTAQSIMILRTALMPACPLPVGLARGRSPHRRRVAPALDSALRRPKTGAGAVTTMNGVINQREQ